MKGNDRQPYVLGVGLGEGDVQRHGEPGQPSAALIFKAEAIHS